MPRTFTLAGLMIGVTLIAALCGRAVKDEEGLAYALIVGSLAPAALLCLTLVSFSRRRKFVLTLSVIGAVIGAWLGLPKFGVGPAMTIWQALTPVLLPIAISSTLGALLFGGIALALDPPVSPPPEP